MTLLEKKGDRERETGRDQVAKDKSQASGSWESTVPTD